MADMSATISDKISYNDNHASPPYVFTFGGFGSPPTVLVAPSLKCSTDFFYKSIHVSGGAWSGVGGGKVLRADTRPAPTVPVLAGVGVKKVIKSYRPQLANWHSCHKLAIRRFSSSLCCCFHARRACRSSCDI